MILICFCLFYLFFLIFLGSATLYILYVFLYYFVLLQFHLKNKKKNITIICCRMLVLFTILFHFSSSSASKFPILAYKTNYFSSSTRKNKRTDKNFNTKHLLNDIYVSVSFGFGFCFLFFFCFFLEFNAKRTLCLSLP